MYTTFVIQKMSFLIIVELFFSEINLTYFLYLLLHFYMAFKREGGGDKTFLISLGSIDKKLSLHLADFFSQYGGAGNNSKERGYLSISNCHLPNEVPFYSYAKQQIKNLIV